MIGLLILAVAAAGLYVCAGYVFAPDRKQTLDPYVLPKGDIYKKNPHITRGLLEGALALPFEEVTITSHDGLTLYGRYYAGQGDGPLQIMFHGYQSSAIRDFCGGLQLALDLGCSALVVDQRAHGKSSGKYLTFGVKERLDCRDWVAYAAARWPGTPLVLTGISMGAATVLMASELELPHVKGIVADCGYTSPRAILRKVIADMHLPVGLTYGLVRLSARLYCGFDTDDGSAPEALAKTALPCLFIHGEADDFVPCTMSRENYAACAGEKTILTVPGAAHGLSFTTDYDAYRAAVSVFLEKYAK